MKIVTIVGSMRKEKYTNALANCLISDIEQIDNTIKNETIYIFDQEIEYCRVICSQHCKNHNYDCCITDDVASVFQRMKEADAVIFAAPLYFRAPPAKFHAFVERLISIHFYKESQGKSAEEPPFSGKPYVLIGIAGYSNPYQMLEYLNDFVHVLNMNPIKLKRFPYLGLGGQGDIFKDNIFNPLERSKEMAELLVKNVKEMQ